MPKPIRERTRAIELAGPYKVLDRDPAQVPGSTLAKFKAERRDEDQETDAIRGIQDRTTSSSKLFRTLARGDFKHDFGEGVDTRDKFVLGDAQRFFDIAKLVSKKGTVWLRSKFIENVGTNLFRLIEDEINTILPRGLSKPELVLDKKGKEIFKHEDDLLLSMGIDWKKLKDEIVALGAPVKGEDRPLEYMLGPPEVKRPYQIRACPYRLGKRGEPGYDTNTAPIDALRIVTGTPAGKNQSFVCIVDASGGFPLSDLRNRDLLTQPSGGDAVYIIENLENGADSATKLLPPPILPKKEKGRVFKDPPQLATLRDTETTVNYPLWAKNPRDPKSNIYSSFHIVLNRAANDTVEANILQRDPFGVTTEAYSISDVSNASNVKNASLYALAMILENGVTNEALVYTLIKRMGDWCQALSLLDLDREYIPTNPDNPKEAGDPTTLRKLQAQGAEIGIVTNDRILLAFSIFLGLNVFYTSAMDIAQLIYFKNTLVTSSPTAISDRLQKTLEQVNLKSAIEKIAPHMESIAKTRTDMLAKLAAEPSLPGYISKLRNLLSNLARLRLDLPVHKDQLTKEYGIAANEANEPAMRLTAANAAVSLLAKIETDIRYNVSVLTDIQASIYPDSKKEKMQLDELEERMKSKGRLAKTIGVTNAKDILKRVAEDIDQVLGKTPDFLLPLRTTPEDFRILPAEENAYATFKEILSVMPALSLRLNYPKQAGGSQRGGGPALDAFTAAVSALKTTTIRILARDDRGDTEVTSTVNIYRIGSLYYDRTLTGYTVVDESIIRKEDLVAFDLAFRALSNLDPADVAKPDDVMFVCARYLLLRVDLALNTLNKLDIMATPRVAPTEIEIPGTIGNGTPGYAAIVDLGLLEGAIRTALGQIGDLNQFATSVTRIHGTKLTPDDDFRPDPRTVATGFETFRATLIARLGTGPPNAKIAEERDKTKEIEQTLPGIQATVPQDVRILEAFVQRNQDLLRATDPAVQYAIGNAVRGEAVLGNSDTLIAGSAQDEFEYIADGFARVVVPVAYIGALPAVKERAIATIREAFALHLRNVAAGRDVPPAPRAAAVGLPGFQGGGESTSNAGDLTTGSSRRGLYEGLRKRGGSRSPPGV